MMDYDDWSGFHEDDAWDDNDMQNYGFDYSEPPQHMPFSRRQGSGAYYGSGRGFRGPPPLFHGPPRMRPPMPMGEQAPFMWGRGFGPRGPPVSNSVDNKVVRYLMRCGIAREQVKALPGELLELLEPQYCGICGQEFDSFNSSRLHYSSKNHLRNQNKWLAQQPDVPYRHQRPREIPLKARELYCELCDVQITSKAHAESHYSGRSHRAIVERRKKPKNPTLLTKEKFDRVEQLIRREKKHLKAPVEEKEKEEKEVKIVPPELYCDICKTSVTCSEQMTMHLNGKRHLTKEKQHILKMMKGEVAAEEPATVNEATQPGGSAEDQAASAEDKSGDDKDQTGAQEDWGNGSGNWDDQPTAKT